MRIGLAQLNTSVGDLAGNTNKVIEIISRAKVDLLIFPELTITGYPPEDLILKPQFITDNLTCLKQVAKHCKDTAVCLGFVDRSGKDLFNAAAFIVNGKIKEIYHKKNLPNYSVFDEKRYFKEGKKAAIINFKNLKIGLGICEDIWAEDCPKGARLIININASPYYIGKVKERIKLLKKRARDIIYVNQVGGQDELIFDGGSMAVNSSGRVIANAAQYKEELLIIDYPFSKPQAKKWLDPDREIYEAILLSVGDYVKKNKFREAVIGLSGGIDSALTLAIAADALGKKQVHAVFMPSQFTSKQSFKDASRLAKNLGIDFKIIPIKDLYKSYLKILTPRFEGKKFDITEENLQARIRGNMLMALSNKFGWLVLSTGNKSEMSVGYCTLYGDMVGGFGVLKDVSKELVYRLAKYRNRLSKDIPQAIIKRAPTAELRPNQKDEDSLPPYPVLDSIIEAYIEKNKSPKQIIQGGIKKEIVYKVISLIDSSEYKRRQAPPGPRITPRAFGKDWRMPITSEKSK